MFTVDRERLLEAMHLKGYRSIGQLAQALGVHRNTIQYYLSGQGIFPANFQKLLKALDLHPAQILVRRQEKSPYPQEAIAGLVDQLHGECPQITFVLFGSWAQKKASKYSDWDIGVFSRDGISHPLYRKLVKRAGDLAENLPFVVDVVNLNRAENQFLTQAAAHWSFLAGRQQDWIALQRRVLP